MGQGVHAKIAQVAAKTGLPDRNPHPHTNAQRVPTLRLPQHPPLQAAN
jgi:hypothetical protein